MCLLVTLVLYVLEEHAVYIDTYYEEARCMYRYILRGNTLYISTHITRKHAVYIDTYYGERAVGDDTYCRGTSCRYRYMLPGNTLYISILMRGTRCICITRNTLCISIQGSTTILTTVKRNQAEFHEGAVTVVF